MMDDFSSDKFQSVGEYEWENLQSFFKYLKVTPGLAFILEVDEKKTFSYDSETGKMK